MSPDKGLKNGLVLVDAYHFVFCRSDPDDNLARDRRAQFDIGADLLARGHLADLLGNRLAARLAAADGLKPMSGERPSDRMIEALKQAAVSAKCQHEKIEQPKRDRFRIFYCVKCRATFWEPGAEQSAREE